MLWTPNKPIFETKNVPHKIGPWKFRYRGQIALFGPLGPSEDLRGRQKGHFKPKRALLGPPGAQKGLDTRSKCVVSMSPIQAGQSGAVETKFGPSGPPESPKRGISGQNGPF